MCHGTEGVNEQTITCVTCPLTCQVKKGAPGHLRHPTVHLGNVADHLQAVQYVVLIVLSNEERLYQCQQLKWWCWWWCW
ncbi:hypothetical protein E2C01_102330 [Portunus trituberculatus]|uniref:Uncharacterized protein n=1 Tax=Portunus trituberculatus TaxID=210409 RepID=A0A5B7KI66_PORTR|nr:hypothetical protein [Portunus trituberculatus]